MLADREAVLAAALALPESDRLSIVDQLLATLPPDSPEAWEDDELAAELRQRRQDQSGSVDWASLRDESIGG